MCCTFTGCYPRMRIVLLLLVLGPPTAGFTTSPPHLPPYTQHLRLPQSSAQRSQLLILKASHDIDRQSFLKAALLLGGSTFALTPIPSKAGADTTLLSDEYEVVFDSSSRVGLSLADFGDKGKYRTYVKGVIKGSQAERLGVTVPALVVSVNGANVEGLPASFVVKLFRQAEGSELRVVFRDPAKFEQLLADKTRPAQQEAGEGGAAAGGGGEQVAAQEFSTQVAPETKARQAQVLTVKKLEIPEICGYGAKYGDLLEVRYTTSLDDGTFLDATGLSNRGGDSTLYFVLGQQPTGQFPKGWDLSLAGACVGERREVRVPPVMAYGPKGLKKRGIPADSTIVYDITVVGINGNNLPR